MRGSGSVEGRLSISSAFEGPSVRSRRHLNFARLVARRKANGRSMPATLERMKA